jgi:hypothetical protein
MNKHLFIKLIGLFFACFFSNAQATLLTVKLPGNTVNYTTTVGSTFDANIYIDSVADFAGFDFTLSFNSAKLSALSLTSGNIFSIADTDILANSITPSTVNYAEAISLSSLLPTGFNINAPTLLATVRFQALGIGVNNLISFSALTLSDFIGTPIGATAQGAFVTINQAVVPPPPPPLQQVPEPASAFLFATGLLALFGLRGNKKTTSA